jgi:hypothetical protein
MVNVRPRQDPDYLMSLKRGEDRGGVSRSWDQVGAMRGISGQHAMRVANRIYPKAPPVVRIDPRTIVPELASILSSDQDAQAWNDEHLCLCGCGQATLQESGRFGKVPFGAFRLFRGAHDKRMPWVRIRQLQLTPAQKRKRIRALITAQDTIVAAGIAGLIMEWKSNPRHSIRDLAEKTGLSDSHIRAIAAGRNTRIQKVTAVRLLVGMGEPLRPELRQIYRQWQKSTQAIEVT